MSTARSRTLLIAATVALVALALLGGLLWWQSIRWESARRLTYVIPPGTAARIAAGEEVEVFPSTITMTLGKQDILVVRNEDSEPVTIGPLIVQSGQSFEQQFSRPRVYELTCSLKKEGRFQIVVLPES